MVWPGRVTDPNLLLFSLDHVTLTLSRTGKHITVLINIHKLSEQDNPWSNMTTWVVFIIFIPLHLAFQIDIDKERKYLQVSDARWESLGCQMKHICYVIGSIISYLDWLLTNQTQHNLNSITLHSNHCPLKILWLN